MKFTATLIAILLALNSISATYTTLNDGTWDDNINVWSTNGVTPCFCDPGNTVDGDEVVINHNIITTGNLKFTGGADILISSTGNVGDAYNLTIEDATFTVNGTYEGLKIVQKAGSIVNVIGVLTLNSKYDLQEGTLNVIDGFVQVTSGNLDIGEFAIVNMIAAMISAGNGNLNNEGIMNIDANSCASTSGQWTNENTGVVNGSGSATSTSGNMINLNVWDPAITWCSAGSDSGIPSAEDCLTANTNCGSILLPVELVSFEARVKSEFEIELSWVTDSEKDCDYFKVTYFENGEWIQLTTVQGNGNSNETIEYSVIQRIYETGIMYFRLVQVDFNGDEYFSEVKTIEVTTQDFEIYPNPAQRSDNLTLSNLTKGSTVVLYDSQGELHSEVLISDSNLIQISTADLNAGVYYIKVVNSSFSSIQKVVVL